jgi:tRNA nucleotidyltransferase/poly(A) polymerase
MPKIYRVGGCVRDNLLNKQSNDIDYTFVSDSSHIDLTIEDGFKEMTEWLETNSFNIYLSTPSMLTIRAKFPDSKLTADFVLARKELKYNDNSRKPLVKPGSLHDDLIRRDFTINAMAQEEDGTIIDLFDGKVDLENKLLRTPTDPMITMLDDPLRILRAMRFSIVLKFEIDEKLMNAMTSDDVLYKFFNVVSKERIRTELYKMFRHDTITSLRLLYKFDEKSGGKFIDRLFKNDLWLKPTYEL